MWNQIEDLFKKKVIISHQIVYNEIVPIGGPKDDIGKLVSRHKSSFFPITNRQGQLALKILATFPRLIDPRSTKDEADPWIIAMVMERMEDEDLFGKDSDYIVISSESKKSDSKIPAVCKHFQVRHMNLFEFFENNQWRFAMKLS
ncbi:MAG: DUF4411 family protein [Bacteroidota bacterium]